MTYEEALTFIDSLLVRERPALDQRDKLRRVEELLRRLGDPHRRQATVLIAGTKGKGSTAAMLASMMEMAGQRVGLYTKPHLVEYRERIRINGQLVEPSGLVRLVEIVRPHVEAMATFPLGVPTYFEVSVALAFLHFAMSHVQLAVVEVGLGGRLDATNVADPLLSVITPVSYDHMDVLGNTLEAIAREKAGIIRSHGRVVSAPQVPEALAAIIEVCARHRAQLHLVNEVMHWRTRTTSLHDQTFTLHGPWRDYGQLRLPLIGAHQLVNAATAVAGAELLADQGFPLPQTAVAAGLAAVRWPARVEVVRERPYVILDVAHNPASIAALRETLDAMFPDHRIILVFAMVATHDHHATTSLIAPRADVAIITTAQHVKPLPADVLAETVRQYARTVEVIEDRFAAVDRALALAQPEDVVVITGSFFLVGDLRDRLIRTTQPTQPTQSTQSTRLFS